ncbi:glycosyltransferase [Rhizobiaceae bacterium BDR2-2]|uniref:Glycosyltransferase n=1 Tax=Ectorhizobium quercum TaxID=2965071 RepID=A0AAE3MXQ0_9HYPH|nr:glycosyltransferase [Ectorhizobium quercum]MCX8996222.1 glycosyltransferase [Ectorhizobium quercum]MCX8998739.1 glycosyltransferase [Ectorhizobium quercum]
MKIGYFLNTYPVPSGTFIRREIEALEAEGETVSRFAVRRFAGELVDPRDIAESDKTVYLLEGNVADLMLSTLREILLNPAGVMRMLPAWITLVRNAGGEPIRHAAYAMQAASLRRKTRRAGIAHVHAHYGTNTAAVVMLARLMGGPRYSFTAHGPDEFVDAESRSYALKIRHSSFVVAISDYCKRVLSGIGGDEDSRRKIEVVRCGLRLEDFVPPPPIQPGNLTLVCVGRLCPQKGQVHIPAAVAALRGDFPQLRVILVGDGESRADVEAEIRRHGVERQVLLHGWASNEEVRRLIRDGRALLLPSYAEGLPIVLMESLALCRPVITTTIAGIPELVDATCGWLVQPGDHAQLVAAMRSALEATPADIDRMGRAGRARVMAMHDIRRLAGDLARLFAGGGNR